MEFGLFFRLSKRRKNMQIKRMLIVNFLCLVIISCAKQQEKVFSTVQPKLTTTPYPTFTPEVTATPLISNNQGFDAALNAHLNLGDSCKVTDKLNSSTLNVVFLETKQEPDSRTEFVSEVANSADGKYSAYIVQHYALDIMSDKVMPIYCEGCGKVYLENIQDGKKYQITWNALPLGISMIYSSIWVDDNILIVREAQSEDFYLALGFDVNKQVPVYYSEVSCSKN
jgi:hypothetical protein